MPIVRCSIELQHDTGLSRDKTVMTFHVAANDLLDSTLEPIAEDVRDFLVTIPTGDTVAPMNLLSTSIADTGHFVKVYDLGTPNTPPNWTEPFDFVGRSPIGADNLPGEVALCISMRNESVTATPARNRRGRVYFGPLRGAVSDQTGTTEVRPQTSRMTTLARAVDTLRTRLAANLVPSTLVIYSRVLGTSFPVERIHVDNAWDTVRSRGIAATSRVWAPSAP